MRVPPQTVKNIHFVGIGGIGMSGIAEVLHNLGYIVTGSDSMESANVVRLRELGIKVAIGHAPENIDDAQVLVTSTAVKAHNPEIVEARSRAIPVIRRADMLAELMQLKLSVAVSGTHGKTTTTSLMATLFEAADLDPTIVNGGIINAYGTNARLGKGEWIVVEADESDGSFTRLPATIAVVTNMDPEHMDFYKDYDDMKNAFWAFVERIPFYGLGVLCIDHPEVRAMVGRLIDRRLVTYGFCEDAMVRAVNLRESTEGIIFDVDLLSPGILGHRSLSKKAVPQMARKITDLFLPMMGRHNVQNALAVVAVAQELGMDDDVLMRAFGNFKGVKRRFSRVGAVNGVTIIDDYAHHPVEIKTVISAARQATKGRIWAVYQPHRYTRLLHLFDDFIHCFEGVDGLVMAPVYSAGETPIEGVTSTRLAEAVRNKGLSTVLEIKDPIELAGALHTHVQPGDMILCMGAGTITQWAAQLPEQLEALYAPATEAQSSYA